MCNYIQIFYILNTIILRYLRAFKHSFLVNCHIDRVWEFFTDIKHLEIITPMEIELKISNATNQKLTQGSEFWLEGKLMMMLKEVSGIL